MQLQAISVRVKNFGKSMDSGGMVVLLLAETGAMSGFAGSDEEDDPTAYHAYEVTGKWATDPPPVDVIQSKTAAAFGQPGGGIQYEFVSTDGTGDVSVQWLIDNGYLEEVAP